MEVKVVLDKGAIMPTKAHETDAGFDLYSPDSILIPSGGYSVINTGVHMEIPKGYVGMLKSKSGLNVRYSIQSEGVIDCGYTGAIIVKLYNKGSNYMVHKGDKITQIVVLPIPEVELVEVSTLEDTDRGDGGFGSTGR